MTKMRVEILPLFACLLYSFSASALTMTPYIPPSYDDVLNSPQILFAHYVFSPLQYSQTDYWPNDVCMYYIIPANTPTSAGNQRLCPASLVSCCANSSYIINNLKAEIARMIAVGINGVALDLFSTCDWSESGVNCPGFPGALINMLHAAAGVDSRFKVLPMPDMTAGIKPSDLPNLWTATIGSTTIYHHPNIYRWPDANNYPQLSPFCTECFPESNYSSAFATMNSAGTPISWAPIFGSLGCNGSPNGCVFSPYISLPTVSVGGFGGLLTSLNDMELALTNVGGPLGGNTYGGGPPINWVGPVKIFGGMNPQAYQSASGTLYESQNSLAYRVGWESQFRINSSLGNIMVVTWNDYGESTAIQASANQYGEPSLGFYALTGYYTTWWRQGAPPTIVNDAILYFYRKQTYAAAHGATIAGLTKPPTLQASSSPAQDEVEMVAFLTSPATMAITINNTTTTYAGTTGLNAFTVPQEAATPMFSILRGNATILSIPGIQTYGNTQLPAGQVVPGLTLCSPASTCFPAGIPDPVYYSDSTFNPICDLSESLLSISLWNSTACPAKTGTSSISGSSSRSSCLFHLLAHVVK